MRRRARRREPFGVPARPGSAPREDGLPRGSDTPGGTGAGGLCSPVPLGLAGTVALWLRVTQARPDGVRSPISRGQRRGGRTAAAPGPRSGWAWPRRATPGASRCGRPPARVLTGHASPFMSFHAAGFTGRCGSDVLGGLCHLPTSPGDGQGCHRAGVLVPAVGAPTPPMTVEPRRMAAVGRTPPCASWGHGFLRWTDPHCGVCSMGQVTAPASLLGGEVHTRWSGSLGVGGGVGR